MNAPEYDIIVPGDYFYDLIYTGLTEFPVLGREIYSEGLIATGGAMFITAASLRRLGVRVGWAGCFGSDYYSRYVRDMAADEQIDLSLIKTLDRPYRRVTTSIPYQGERAFITYTDPKPEDLHAHWLTVLQQHTFSHLHLGSMTAIDDLLPLAEVAHARGATISMDCQDVPHLESVCAWCDVLGLVDVFMPNAREALIVSGTSALQSALECLMDWTKVIVVKDGSNGAWIAAEGRITHVPAIHAGRVVDTTGAGDCFNAGFLLGYVIEHAPLERCALYGNICGGLSVTGIGGATAAPTRSELADWLARLQVS